MRKTKTRKGSFSGPLPSSLQTKRLRRIPFEYINIEGRWECSVYRFAAGTDKLLDMSILSFVVPYEIIVVPLLLLSGYLLLIKPRFPNRSESLNETVFEWGLIWTFPIRFLGPADPVGRSPKLEILCSRRTWPCQRFGRVRCRLYHYPRDNPP